MTTPDVQVHVLGPCVVKRVQFIVHTKLFSFPNLIEEKLPKIS
jgi:hypothetical protein